MHKVAKTLALLVLMWAWCDIAIGQEEVPAADPPANPERPDPANGDEAAKNTDRRRQMREDVQRRRGNWGRRSPEEFLLKGVLHNEKLAETLGITDTQLETLRAEAEAHQAESRGLEEQLRNCGMQQAKIMTQDEVDEDELMQAIDHCFEIQKELAKLKMQQLLLIKRTLTPEQLEAAKVFMQERMKNRMQGMRDGARPDRRRNAETDGPRKPLDNDLAPQPKRQEF
ncbi:MAG: hypothetical protein O2923_07185 [Verrucomicrobia bacterium]|nr:hypothetical protein [Verrucomicrobiota bacterium]MDA1087676.1 hypothetical protein [Verrucomicrobiota bacterium]